MNKISLIIIEVNDNIIKLINSDNPIFESKKVYLKELLNKHLQFIKNNPVITYKTLEEIEDIKQYRTENIHTNDIMNDEIYKKVYTNMMKVKLSIMQMVYMGKHE